MSESEGGEKPNTESALRRALNSALRAFGHSVPRKIPTEGTVLPAQPDGDEVLELELKDIVRTGTNTNTKDITGHAIDSAPKGGHEETEMAPGISDHEILEEHIEPIEDPTPGEDPVETVGAPDTSAGETVEKVLTAKEVVESTEFLNEMNELLTQLTERRKEFHKVSKLLKKFDKESEKTEILAQAKLIALEYARDIRTKSARNALYPIAIEAYKRTRNKIQNIPYTGKEIHVIMQEFWKYKNVSEVGRRGYEDFLKRIKK